MQETEQKAVAILEVGYLTYMVPMRGIISDFAHLVAGAERVEESYLGGKRVIVLMPEDSYGQVAFKIVKREVLTKEEYDVRNAAEIKAKEDKKAEEQAKSEAAPDAQATTLSDEPEDMPIEDAEYTVEAEHGGEIS
jgi:CRISPR/Cas system CSM-associated protein Csm3 (group 7 of RAMP superfamily)